MPRKFTILFVTLLLLALPIASASSAHAQVFEPIAGAEAPNLIQDPSLEAAIASTAIWKQASSNSDTPLCTLSIPECNFGPGATAPRTGSVWALFGGIDWTDPEALSPEVGDLYQNVVFPSCGASLKFYFWIGAAPAGSDASDVFNVKIDGTTVFSANATQKSSYPAYTLVDLDVSAYANGAAHKVEFYSVTAGQTVIFNLDDVSLTRTCFTLSGNAGVASATLNYTGGSSNADGSGNYSFHVPYDWSGTVTPSKSGYIFSPASRTYANVTSDYTGQNYTATAVHTISGNVGVAGVTLSYTDGTPKTVLSESNGNYSFTILDNWSGTVTPSHPCFTFNPTDRSYTNVITDQTSQDYTPTAIPGSGCVNIDVLIAGTNQGSFAIDSQGTMLQAPFTGINSGPVKITSTVPIIGGERVIYKVNGVNTSFSEMIGLPDGQLDTIYWLPWYNNVDLDTQLRLANVNVAAATVHVYAGGVELTGSPLTLAAGASIRKSFPGVNGGVVKIQSNIPIVAAERVIYKVNNVNTSYSEMMALPNSQLDSIYWLPWYNNVDLDSQLRLANVNGAPATVHVYVAGVEMTGSPFTLPAGASIRRSFPGVNGGVVKIQSDVPIVAAERVIYKVNNVNTSYSEMMALPNSQLDNIYWLPRYNNVDLDSQLRLANVSGTPATVHVYVAGVEMTGSPFTLAAGASIRRSFPGVNSGLVKIQSDVPIVAAERVIYKAAGGVNTSYSEMMALPDNQLDITSWLPWYNNVDLNTYLRFGVP